MGQDYLSNSVPIPIIRLQEQSCAPDQDNVTEDLAQGDGDEGDDDV